MFHQRSRPTLDSAILQRPSPRAGSEGFGACSGSRWLWRSGLLSAEVASFAHCPWPLRNGGASFKVLVPTPLPLRIFMSSAASFIGDLQRIHDVGDSGHVPSVAFGQFTFVAAPDQAG